MDDLPALEEVVTVTLDDGTTFRACRVMVLDENERDCWAWAAVDELTPGCPPCWTDGVCWATNDDGIASRPVVAWRR